MNVETSVVHCIVVLRGRIYNSNASSQESNMADSVSNSAKKAGPESVCAWQPQTPYLGTNSNNYLPLYKTRPRASKTKIAMRREIFTSISSISKGFLLEVSRFTSLKLSLAQIL